jgi:glutaredoxin
MDSENRAENRPPVILFALSTCSHCKDVKKLLDSRKVEYRKIEVDLLEGEDRKKAIEQVKQYNSRVTFPTTVIGETTVVGNKKDRIEEALARIE